MYPFLPSRPRHHSCGSKHRLQLHQTNLRISSVHALSPYSKRALPIKASARAHPAHSFASPQQNEQGNSGRRRPARDFRCSYSSCLVRARRGAAAQSPFTKAGRGLAARVPGCARAGRELRHPHPPPPPHLVSPAGRATSASRAQGR